MSNMAREVIPRIELAVLEQAAEWFALLGAGQVDSTEQARWQQWLQASAAHREAWRQVQQIGSRLQALPVTPAMRALQAPTLTRRRLLRSTSAFGLVVGIGAIAGVGWRHRSVDLRTGIGERREQVLADGTRLWLNSDTRVDVDYDAHQRLIALIDGEILVSTARDSRPLWVRTSHGLMRAIGTRFSVRSDNDADVLAVFEGAVELHCEEQTRRLTAGQQCRFDGAGIAAVNPAEVRREAWTRGLLVVDNLRLDEVISELARHHRAHFAVASDVAALRLVGTYRLDDIDQTLAAVQQTLPVAIRRPLPWWISVDARS